MLSTLTNGWSFNPMMFLDLFFVLAFACGWLILEYVAGRYDKAREKEADKEDAGE